MVGILIISHSYNLAKATKEFVEEMKSENFNFNFYGGINDGKDFGSDPMEIKNAIEKTNDGDGVLIIGDLGSSIMNAQMALNFLDEELQTKTRITNSAFLESAFLAVVSNNEKQTVDSLLELVESTPVKKF